VALASRWLLGWAFASPAAIRFGLALFPVPAHRTGQAELPHPALGKDSRGHVVTCDAVCNFWTQKLGWL